MPAHGSDGTIYVIGGSSQSPVLPTNTVITYDPVLDKWDAASVPDMRTRRYALSVATGAGGRGLVPPRGAHRDVSDDRPERVQVRQER